MCTNCPTNEFSKNETAVVAITTKPVTVAEVSSTRTDPPPKCPFINWIAPQQCILQYPGTATTLSPKLSNAFNLTNVNDDKQNQGRTQTTSSSTRSSQLTSTTSPTLQAPSSASKSSMQAIGFSIVLIALRFFTIVNNIDNIAWTKFQLQFAGL